LAAPQCSTLEWRPSGSCFPGCQVPIPETSQMPLRRTGSIKCPLGDCFSASGEQVETVTVVDCEQAHIHEVFAAFDHEVGADQPYPGDDELLKYADTACQPRFEGLRRDRLPVVDLLDHLSHAVRADLGRRRSPDRVRAQARRGGRGDDWIGGRNGTMTRRRPTGRGAASVGGQPWAWSWPQATGSVRS